MSEARIPGSRTGRPATRNPIVVERPKKPQPRFELDPFGNAARRFDGERR
jgi:hypothetical protein